MYVIRRPVEIKIFTVLREYTWPGGYTIRHVRSKSYLHSNVIGNRKDIVVNFESMFESVFRKS